MPLEQALTALAQSVQVAVDSSGAANRTFVATLVAPGREKLTVTDMVTTTEIVQAPIDLDWRTKDVRFAVADIADDTVVGGMPVNDLLALNVSSVTTGPSTPPGVPGVVGALAGTIPLPIEVTSPTQLDVDVDVRWRVRDGGAIVDDLTWSIAGSPAVAGQGGDIAPPFGRGLDPLTLTFDLVMVELLQDPSPTVQRRLEASIRLAAGGTTTDWIDLPPVPLTLPAIPVPTIAIFCQGKDFGSNKLVVVPASSPLDGGTVGDAFDTLRNTIAPLASTLSFLGLFVSQAGLIADLLDDGNVTFRKTNQVSNLNDIDLESGFFNDTEAEDELSSMLLVGPPRRRIECFNKRNFGTGEGQMNLTVGTELVALVANLHSASPASDPAGRVSVPHGPSGTRWSGLDPWQDITGFGDEFSSIRFSWG